MATVLGRKKIFMKLSENPGPLPGGKIFLGFFFFLPLVHFFSPSPKVSIRPASGFLHLLKVTKHERLRIIL